MAKLDFFQQSTSRYKKWFFILALLCILYFLTTSVIERYHIERKMAERRQVAEVELQKLEAREAYLEEQVSFLEDERGVEEMLRKNFNVVKPGERVIILTGETSDTEKASSDTVATDSAVTTPWYVFWRKW